ncbi:MAG: hypothetical protein ABR511_04680 [Acidimicrobiales bacterium]
MDPRPPPRFRPRFRWRRTGRKVALTAHILASLGWFGVAVLVLFSVLAARATTDATLSASLYRTVGLALWVSVPLGVASFLSGEVLGLGTPWGVLRYWWLVAKVAVNIAVVATDLAVIAPMAHRAITSGVGPDALGDGAIAHCVALTVATVLSVFKPGGRTPRGRRQQQAAGGRPRRAEPVATPV